VDRGVSLAHSRLYLGRAAQRIDNTRELDQEPVPGRMHDPAPMLGYLAVEQIRPDRL